MREGDRIKKGEILVKIDPTEVEAAIQRARAALEAAKTSLSDAEQDVSRSAELAKRNVVTREFSRKAKVARDVSESRLAEAQAAFDAALSGRAYTSVRSPFDGTVIGRHKENGDLAGSGVPILTIESKKRLLFETFIAESRVAQLQVGAQVKVTIDALAGREVVGLVLRFASHQVIR